MSLTLRLDQDIKEALKAGEKQKLTVLRGLKSALKYKQIEIGEELTDEQFQAVMGSQAKKVRDSLEQFEKGGRDDLVAEARFELGVIEAYLPQQLSEDELRQIVAKAIEENEIDSPKKIGLLMKAVMPLIKGRADGKQVNKLAMEILAN